MESSSSHQRRERTQIKQGVLMNYYERHIGDFMKDTMGLTMIEEGAYNRLLDIYYAKEEPLPLDVKECYMLARANSKKERDAVDKVLIKFFRKTDDGFRKNRCDEVIEKYQKTIPESEKKKENAKERQQRARERRKTLFESLSSHGITMPYDATTAEIEAEISRNNIQLVTRDVTQLVTRDNTATSNQYPVPSNHIKPISSVITEGQTNGDEKPQSEHLKTQPTEPAHWVDHFNQHYGTDYGYKTTAQRKHIWPVLTRWCKDGYTVEQVSTAVKRAHEEATEPIVNLILYVDRVLASIQTKKAAPLQWWTTEKGRADKLKELGMSTRPGENNNALVARIQAEIDRRATQ
jgi:uncharacterized protein YdaU (DUF1376 family)